MGKEYETDVRVAPRVTRSPQSRPRFVIPPTRRGSRKGRLARSSRIRGVGLIRGVLLVIYFRRRSRKALVRWSGRGACLRLTSSLVTECDHLTLLCGVSCLKPAAARERASPSCDAGRRSCLPGPRESSWSGVQPRGSAPTAWEETSVSEESGPSFFGTLLGRSSTRMAWRQTERYQIGS